jgi:hypothetical protein
MPGLSSFTSTEPAERPPARVVRHAHLDACSAVIRSARSSATSNPDESLNHTRSQASVGISPVLPHPAGRPRSARPPPPAAPNDPGQVKSCTPPPDPVGSNAWGMVPEGVHILRRRVGRTGVCARSPRRPTAAADGPVSAMRWDAGCAVLGSTRRAGVEEGDAARRRRGRWSRDGPAPRTPSLLRRPTPPTRLGSSVSSRCGRR